MTTGATAAACIGRFEVLRTVVIVVVSGTGAAVGLASEDVVGAVLDKAGSVADAAGAADELTGGGSFATGGVSWARAVVDENAMTAAIAGKALVRALISVFHIMGKNTQQRPKVAGYRLFETSARRMDDSVQLINRRLLASNDGASASKAAFSKFFANQPVRSEDELKRAPVQAPFSSSTRALA